MRLRSFRSRVVFLFLLLLTLVQIVGFIAVHTITTHNAREQAKGDVAAAATTFDGFIDLRTKRLAEGGRLLSSDYAFKTALFSSDQATILSALENHAARIGAELAILMADGRIIADTIPRSPDDRSAVVRRLTPEIEHANEGAFALITNDRVYQVVIVPVLAPSPVAWLALGLVVDDRLAREVSEIVRTQVSIATEQAPNTWRLVGSTLPSDLRPVVSHSLARSVPSAPVALTMQQADYITLVTPMKIATDVRLVAVVQRSLDDVSRRSNTFRTTVTLFLSIGLVGSLIAGTLVGRAVSKPIVTLVEGVRRIEQGDYGERIPGGGADELGQLTRAVNEMATAVETSRSALERTVVESTALYEIARTVSREDDVDAALRQIAEKAQTLMAAEATTIVFDRGGNLPRAISVPAGTARAKDIEVATTGHLTAIANTATAERLDVADGAFSALVLPIRLGRLPPGALAVARARGAAFAEGEVRLLSALADLAAIALENDALDSEIRGHAAGLEATVKERTRELELASQHKSEFLANMSHELRTPLTAIIGFARIVIRRCKDMVPARQYENLEKILFSAEHLLALINNLLDLSKIEAGHIEIQPEPIALDPLIEECLRIMEPLTAPERLQLVRDVDPTLPTLYSDEAKLRQILINLLNNAIKFTESGTITVTARRRGSETVDIAVSDTGIGIPRAALGLIFEKFRQVDGGLRRQYGGTGLGLSISRQLAQFLGGDITVESEVGAGTTFTLTVPLVYTPVLVAGESISPV